MTAKTARCNFCGRTFSSAQGVRAHLKSCTNYQRKKSNPSDRHKLPRQPIRQPKQLPREVPAKATTLGAATQISQNHTQIQDNAVYSDNDLHKKKYRRDQEDQLRRCREEEERRRRQDEQEANRKRQEEYEHRKRKDQQESKERKRRETIQTVKNSVINWYVTCHVIPNEIKANALIVIERVLEKLPILELPMSELVQIGEGIRDKVYAPYLKPLEVKDYKREEVKAMAKTKIYSGIFFCPDCDAEFELDQADETELVCNDCGTRLEESEED